MPSAWIASGAANATFATKQCEPKNARDAQKCRKHATTPLAIDLVVSSGILPRLALISYRFHASRLAEAMDPLADSTPYPVEAIQPEKLVEEKAGRGFAVAKRWKVASRTRDSPGLKTFTFGISRSAVLGPPVPTSLLPQNQPAAIIMRTHWSAK